MKKRKSRSAKAGLLTSAIVVALVGVCVFSLYTLGKKGREEASVSNVAAAGGTGSGKLLSKLDESVNNAAAFAGMVDGDSGEHKSFWLAQGTEASEDFDDDSEEAPAEESKEDADVIAEAEEDNLEDVPEKTAVNNVVEACTAKTEIVLNLSEKNTVEEIALMAVADTAVQETSAPVEQTDTIQEPQGAQDNAEKPQEAPASVEDPRDVHMPAEEPVDVVVNDVVQEEPVVYVEPVEDNYIDLSASEEPVQDSYTEPEEYEEPAVYEEPAELAINDNTIEDWNAGSYEETFVESYEEPVYEESYVEAYEESYEEPVYEESYVETYEEPTYEESYEETYEEPVNEESSEEVYEDSSEESYEEPADEWIYDYDNDEWVYAGNWNDESSYEETYEESYDETEEGEWIYDYDLDEWVYVEDSSDYESEEQDGSDESEEYNEESYDESEEYVEESYSSLGQQIVDYAMGFVGVTPYVGGGRSLYDGTDCSGFVHLIFDAFGIYCSPSSMAYDGSSFGYIISYDQARPGDIAVYGGGGHVAIYAGNGYVVHCSSPENGTVYWDMNYRSDLSWFLRVVD